jgi:hypothetical protein
MKLERSNSERRGGGGRVVNDVGGLDFNAIDQSEHELTFYEKRVDAMLMVLVGNSVFRVDALRRAIESYAEQEYDGIPYYDRWMKAIRDLLIEQEVLDADAIEVRISEVCDRLEKEGLEVDRAPVV